MAKNYFSLLLLLLLGSYAHAQNDSRSIPAPDGCLIYAIFDNDDDPTSGVFDIDWLSSVYVPGWSMHHYGYDLSGYTFEWHDTQYNPAQGSAYVGINDQQIQAEVFYNGNGPTYENDIHFLYNLPLCFSLQIINRNADADNDGILNEDEDTNGNGNLLDDDQNGDWTPDYYQQNTLSVRAFATQKWTVAPNPASDVIHIKTPADLTFNLTIRDLTGKCVLQTTTDQQTVNISGIESGIYLVRINSGNQQFEQKLIIR